MFVIFESSDAKKREAVMNRRLMLLRCAYLNGYFDEPGTEPMPEIVADGKGPDDAGPTAHGFNQWCQQREAYQNASPWPKLEKEIERIAEQERRLRLEAELEAIESVCPACAGFGDRRGQNGEHLGVCLLCEGKGVNPKRIPKCQHRNRTAWAENKTICLHCGEIIGRD